MTSFGVRDIYVQLQNMIISQHKVRPNKEPRPKCFPWVTRIFYPADLTAKLRKLVSPQIEIRESTFFPNGTLQRALYEMAPIGRIQVQKHQVVDESSNFWAIRISFLRRLD